MSEFRCEIVKLGKIESLEGSDFLEVTTVMDEYPVILKKGQYQEGQLVSFLSYDSVVPDTEQFHFLSPRELKNEAGEILRESYPVGSVPEKYRTIKSKLIRGTYSEGLIVDAPPGFAEGDSVVKHFGITKRVYPEEVDKTGARDCEKNPEGLELSKYDLDALAKYSYCFEEGERVIIQEKIEGENCTIIYFNGRLYVRSRNLFKKNEEGSYWWKYPLENNLEEKLSKYPGFALWGELYGNVKGWKYDCKVIKNVIQRNFRVFDIWDIKNKKFLEWDNVLEICNDIGVQTVPTLYDGPWKSDRSLNYLAEGKSTIGDCVREGMVVRTVPESWHPKLHRKIAKLKGRDYKLAKG